jgi:hypothetical protein
METRHGIYSNNFDLHFWWKWKEILHNCQQSPSLTLQFWTQFSDLTLQNANNMSQLPDVFLAVLPLSTTSWRRVVTGGVVGSILNLDNSFRLCPLCPYKRKMRPVLIRKDAKWTPKSIWTWQWREKFLSLQWIEPLVVQPVARYCTGWESIISYTHNPLNKMHIEVYFNNIQGKKQHRR